MAAEAGGGRRPEAIRDIRKKGHVMTLARRILLTAMMPALWAGTAGAAGTATFTSDDSGTFGGTFKYDRKTKVLTVALSSVPTDATVFRAELYLTAAGRFGRASCRERV